MTFTQHILLASGNTGKLEELRQLLSGYPFRVSAQSEFGVPAAAETGLTFIENAILKARNACHHSGLPAVADDSGLEVDALNGAPGVFSARFAGANASDSDNNIHLLEALEPVPPEARTARYHAYLVYLRHARDPNPIVCHGVWEGRILQQPQGQGGFGYDPLFWVESEQASAAELPAERKNALSHRGQALRRLVEQLAD
ncbi:MAG: RdgB/HAM1 family non-canonical purine NTP pyrophosphatase [Pseudomonadota bacterium]|nr:RdgB/HAM1 family non-canonical purine NTP pyrophosphatase [Pseudomonadota bacterium]